MKIFINGKPHDLTGPGSLSGVIRDICPQNPYVIAELNGTLIPQDRWQGTPVEDGDHLELVSFVGGG